MPDYTPEFDQVTVSDCRARAGSKWHKYGEGVLGAWIADMDIPAHPLIRDKIRELADVSDLGYTPLFPDSGLSEAFSEFSARRHQWQVHPESVGYLTDILQGLYMAILAFTRPGEGVISTTPIYPPFLSAISNCQREQVLVPFVNVNGRYELDMERLEAVCADNKNHLFLLCNPHNPTGRVLTRQELEQIADITLRHNVVVVSDEIHGDLVYDGQHIPYLSLGPEAADNAIVMTSATKAFNIAGLRTAVCVFGSEQIKQRFYYLPASITAGVNVVGLAATRIAWTQADEWLDQLLAYLKRNRDYAAARLGELDQVNLIPPEATYLMWLDCSQTDFAADAHGHFLSQGKVALNPGEDFGPGGEAHVRLNFATSRQILTQILDQMQAACTSVS